MHTDDLAVGCAREATPGKRVKACAPLPDWRNVIKAAGVGLAAEKSVRAGHDEL